MMGFKLTNMGLQMVLDVEVPETISLHFPDIIHPFLEKNEVTINDIDHLIFHPGGQKNSANRRRFVFRFRKEHQ